MNQLKSILVGKRSKASGSFFEKMIDAGCQYYEEHGIAKIDPALRIADSGDQAGLHDEPAVSGPVS